MFWKPPHLRALWHHPQPAATQSSQLRLELAGLSGTLIPCKKTAGNDDDNDHDDGNSDDNNDDGERACEKQN